MPQKWVLKLDWHGEVRRLREWPQGEAEPSMDVLRTAACFLLDLSLGDDDDLVFKYRDEEGDLCTVAEASLSDALMQASQSGVLRLVAARIPAACAAPPCSPACAPPPNTPVYVDVASPTFSAELTQVAPSWPAESDGVTRAASANVEEAPETELSGVQPSSPSSSAEVTASKFVEAKRSSRQVLEKVRRCASERFEQSRPRLAESLDHFKHQVIDDFRSNGCDMAAAFGPTENDSNAKSKARVLAGTAAGLVAVTRMAPVRASRLAAHSVAAVAGLPAQSPASGDDGEDREDRGFVSQASTEEPADASNGSHFKNQVVNDFKLVRSELKASFCCILGEKSRTGAAAEDPQPESEEQQSPKKVTAKEAIPEVLSSVAGASAAAWLLPLRAARFAIGKMANNHDKANHSASTAVEQ